MKYGLDTNTCIDLLKSRHSDTLAVRFMSMRPVDMHIPSLVIAELMLGARKSNQPQRVLKAVMQFVQPITVVDFDAEAAAHYADIRADLEYRGQIIGPNDLIIAATARAHNLTLVTHNMREFSRVAGLQIEDWRA